MPRLFHSERSRYDLEATHEKLIQLVEHGQSLCVDALLTEMERVGTPCNLKISAPSGDSLVGMAADRNDLRTMKVLLRHGAPNDQPSRASGLKPIIIAEIHGNEEMVNLLKNPTAFLNTISSASPRIG